MVLAAAAAIAGLAAVSASTSTGGARVRTNAMVNGEGPIDVWNSPSVARNPTRGDNLVVSYRMDRPGFSANLAWSDDGGGTWTPATLPLPADVPPCAASPKGDPCPFGPDVAFGADGTLYVAYVSLRGKGNEPGDLWLSTSTDGGRTLAQPTRVSGELAFQVRLAVDPKGPVYVTWLQGFGTGNLSFTEPNPYVVAARSDDRGRTFSSPVRVSDPARSRIGGPSPVVDGRGRLQVLFTDYKENRRDFSALPGPPAERPFALVLATSADGGRTFGRSVEIESGVVAVRRFLIYLPESAQIAAGDRDDLYVSWADGRNGDEDVFLRRSADGGATWTGPVKVNDNPADGTAQFLPKVGVTGRRVDVVFLDGRNDRTKRLLDAYLATSTDRGRSFRNVRLSTRSFDSTVGPTLGTDYGTDFGTKLGLVSSGGAAYAAWTDTRRGSAVTGRQDVFFASVDVGSSRAGLRTALVVTFALAVAALGIDMLRGRSAPQRGRPGGAP